MTPHLFGPPSVCAVGLRCQKLLDRRVRQYANCCVKGVFERQCEDMLIIMTRNIHVIDVLHKCLLLCKYYTYRVTYFGLPCSWCSSTRAAVVFCILRWGELWLLAYSASQIQL